MLVTGLLILTLAGAATAETISGKALVLEKDVTHGTVTLEGQIVLRVRESTRILAADGQPVTLVQLPVARRVSGGAEESADATVRYEARLVGEETVAEEIQVGVQLPD
jgi:hypothetical protein